jgi:hypothetical protein
VFHATDSLAIVVSITTSYSGGPGFEIVSLDRLLGLEIFVAFASSFTNACRLQVPLSRLRLLPFPSFIVHIRNHSNIWEVMKANSVNFCWKPTYCHDLGVWLQKNFGFEIGFLITFTDDSWLYLIIALSLISTVYRILRVKSSPSCSFFTSRCLVTALNNGDSSASVLKSLISGEYSTTELSAELQRHLFSTSLAEPNSQLTG